MSTTQDIAVYVPTPTQAATVAALDSLYRESWKAKMREKPFDLDCGANGRFLIKYPHGGWGYRHRSWRTGPCLVPSVRDAPSDLMTVLAREHVIESRWDEWVVTHADAFAAVRP